MSARLFALVREHDVSGISGTGVVAEGVEFSDGTVVLRWLQAGTARPDHVKPTTVVHDDIDSVIGLHAHNGATRIVYVDEVDGRRYETALEGYCPMGCGATLYRSPNGYTVCGNADCPDFIAATRILDDEETEHAVQVGTVGWTIRHPLRERLGDALTLCTLNEHMSSYRPGAVKPGLYRAGQGENGWFLGLIP